MVRKTNSTGGDVRPVQMYGALTNTESAYRPDSANTNRSELAYEPPSEDDQSVRTMIVCVGHDIRLSFSICRPKSNPLVYFSRLLKGP